MGNSVLSEVPVTGSYECSTEHLHFIFLDYLSSCLLPSKDSWN